MISSDTLTIDTPPVPDVPTGPEFFAGDVVHPLGCYHRKWRVALEPAREAYYKALWAVDAMLTKKQRANPAWAALDVEFSEYLCAGQDHLVAVLATHFPGIAPAIRAVAYHSDDDMDGSGTADCCRPTQEPADEAKTAALRFTYEYARRSAQLDVDLDRMLDPLSAEDRKVVLNSLGELMEWVDANWPDSAAGSPSWPPARRVVQEQEAS